MEASVSTETQKRTFTPTHTRSTKLSSSTRKPLKKKTNALSQFIRKVPSFSGRPSDFYMNTTETRKFISKVAKQREKKYAFQHVSNLPKKTNINTISTQKKEEEPKKRQFLKRRKPVSTCVHQKSETQVAPVVARVEDPVFSVFIGKENVDMSLCEQWKHQQRDLKVLREAMRSIQELREQPGQWMLPKEQTSTMEPMQQLQHKQNQEEQYRAQRKLNDVGTASRVDSTMRVRIKPITSNGDQCEHVMVERHTKEVLTPHKSNSNHNMSNNITKSAGKLYPVDSTANRYNNTPSKLDKMDSTLIHDSKPIIPDDMNQKRINTPVKGKQHSLSLNPPFSPASKVGAALYERQGTHRTGTHHLYNTSTEPNILKQARKMVKLKPAILDMHHDSYFSTTPQMDAGEITSAKRLRALQYQIDFDTCNEQPLFTAQVAQLQSSLVNLENFYLRYVFPLIDMHIPVYTPRFEGNASLNPLIIENALLLPPITTHKYNQIHLNTHIDEFDFSYLLPGYEGNFKSENTESEASKATTPVDGKLLSLIPTYHPMHENQDQWMRQIDIDSVRFTSIKESRAFLTFILQTLPYTRLKLRDQMKSKVQLMKTCDTEMSYMKTKLQTLSEEKERLLCDQKIRVKGKTDQVDDEIDEFILKMESRGISLDKQNFDEFNELILENIHIKKEHERKQWIEEQQRIFQESIISPLTKEHEESLEKEKEIWEKKIAAIREEYEAERRATLKTVEQHNQEYIHQLEVRDSKQLERIYGDVCSKKEESSKTVQYLQGEERRALEAQMASQRKVDEQKVQLYDQLSKLNMKSKQKSELESLLHDMSTHIQPIVVEQVEQANSTLAELKERVWNYTVLEYMVQKEQASLRVGLNQIDRLTSLLRVDNEHTQTSIQKWLHIPVQQNEQAITKMETVNKHSIQIDDYIVDVDQLAELALLLRDI